MLLLVELLARGANVCDIAEKVIVRRAKRRAEVRMNFLIVSLFIKKYLINSREDFFA
jgi:hypothetical protein